MDPYEWSPIAHAPRDGGGVVARSPHGDMYLFIRWDGARWMCGAIPIDPSGFVWRRPSGMAAVA